MGLKIRALHVGDVGLDWSFLIFRFQEGRKTWIPVNSFLILGAEKPILVDTGASVWESMNEETFKACGVNECMLQNQDQDLVKFLRAE